ncbi:MAG: DUF4199 domain-containing protein [Bacteroidota bacterium]
MAKQALKFGLIAGAVMMAIGFLPVLWVGTSDLHCYEYGEAIGYTAMVLGLLSIVLAVRQYRDKELGGYISFGQALGLGLLISVVAALIFVIGDLLYVTQIEPDFLNNWVDCEVGKMEARNASPEEIAEIEAFRTWSSAALETMMFVTVFSIGLVISLASALLLQRKRPPEAV